jgi:hypothetical protein
MLEKLANFNENKNSMVALEARQPLINTKMLSDRDRLTQVEGVLHQHITNLHEGEASDLATKGSFLQVRLQPLLDLVISLPHHTNTPASGAALELYVSRIYRTYEPVGRETTFLDYNKTHATTFSFKLVVHDALSTCKRAESYHNLVGLLPATATRPWGSSTRVR